MGKGNQAPKVDYNAAVKEAKTPDPTQEAISKAALKTLNWADEGDFRNPKEGGMFVNYANPAMLHRNRELQMNAGNQGITALGTADPNYLKTAAQNLKAHQEEADAAQYEGDIKEGVGRATAAAGDVARMDISRDMGVLGATTDIYGREMNKPKWWQAVLGAAGQAGAGFLTGGLSSMMKPRT